MAEIPFLENHFPLHFGGDGKEVLLLRTIHVAIDKRLFVCPVFGGGGRRAAAWSDQQQRPWM
jgi:hypothetical protein